MSQIRLRAEDSGGVTGQSKVLQIEPLRVAGTKNMPVRTEDDRFLLDLRTIFDANDLVPNFRQNEKSA